jgi:hypothetical protein
MNALTMRTVGRNLAAAAEQLKPGEGVAVAKYLP